MSANGQQQGPHIMSKRCKDKRDVGCLRFAYEVDLASTVSLGID